MALCKDLHSLVCSVSFASWENVDTRHILVAVLLSIRAVENIEQSASEPVSSVLIRPWLPANCGLRWRVSYAVDKGAMVYSWHMLLKYYRWPIQGTGCNMNCYRVPSGVLPPAEWSPIETRKIAFVGQERLFFGVTVVDNCVKQILQCWPIQIMLVSVYEWFCSSF